MRGKPVKTSTKKALNGIVSTKWGSLGKGLVMS